MTIEALTVERNEANSAFNRAIVAANPTMDVGTAILTGTYDAATALAALDLRTAQHNLDAAWGASA